jgi:predicted RNase H-like HicB family nuclease
MIKREVALTAVFLKSNDSYVGFVEELPGVNAHGRTLGEARDVLRTLVGVIFDEERRGMEELLVGKECTRESLVLELTPGLEEESMGYCERCGGRVRAR